MKKKKIRCLLILFGAYIMFDGIGSFLIYSNQTMIEHVPRFTRAVIGFLIIWLADKRLFK